jgi:hypothetical protein
VLTTLLLIGSGLNQSHLSGCLVSCIRALIMIHMSIRISDHIIVVRPVDVLVRVCNRIDVYRFENLHGRDPVRLMGYGAAM